MPVTTKHFTSDGTEFRDLEEAKRYEALSGELNTLIKTYGHLSDEKRTLSFLIEYAPALLRVLKNNTKE